MKNKKLFVILLVLFSLLTGCGSKYESAISDINTNANYGIAPFDSYEKGYYEYEEEYIDAEEAIVEEEKIEEIVSETSSEKLVYTASIDIQTLQYDDTIKTIKENIDKYNGFIENENERNNNYNWYVSSYDKTNGFMRNNMVIRIPSEKYYDFLYSLEGTGNIMSKNQNVENITKSYYETSSMIECLEIQEQRLLEMMDSCETIEDMITVERRLTEVQSELRMYQNNLSSMDSDVDYSTINISIEEVVEYSVKNETFFDKLKATISDTCDNFVYNLEEILFFIISIIGYIPFILFISAIAFMIIKLFKRKKIKKIKNINEEKNIDKLKEENFKDKEKE